jgi:hypothetical protein
MIHRHIGPRRDHIELDAAEQRALVELERALLSSPTDRVDGGARRRWTSMRAARLRGLVVRSRRWSPWLLPIGTVFMVVTIPVSVPLAFVCSLLAAIGLAATVDRTTHWWHLRRARRHPPHQ